MLIFKHIIFLSFLSIGFLQFFYFSVFRLLTYPLFTFLPFLSFPQALLSSISFPLVFIQFFVISLLILPLAFPLIIFPSFSALSHTYCCPRFLFLDFHSFIYILFSISLLIFPSFQHLLTRTTSLSFLSFGFLQFLFIFLLLLRLTYPLELSFLCCSLSQALLSSNFRSRYFPQFPFHWFPSILLNFSVIASIFLDSVFFSSLLFIVPRRSSPPDAVFFGIYLAPLENNYRLTRPLYPNAPEDPPPARPRTISSVYFSSRHNFSDKLISGSTFFLPSCCSVAFLDSLSASPPVCPDSHIVPGSPLAPC